MTAAGRIAALASGAAVALLLCGADENAAARGREAFEKRCTGCHALDTPKLGPPLRRVFGHRAASTPQFPYSDALKKSQVKWDEGTLDRWLADPDRLVPGNDMSFRLENSELRRDIIAYLKRLADSPIAGQASDQSRH